MAYSSPPPPPCQPAPPPPPPQQQQQHRQYDTTLTLALAPPPPPVAIEHVRGPGPQGGAAAHALVRSSPTGDTPPCTECGKRFPSWKALFGHMRCHPERQWRGITPPPRFHHGGTASASASTAAAAAAGRYFTLQEREVAASLLLLAGARNGASGKGKKTKILPAASPGANESCGTAASVARNSVCVCVRELASGRPPGGGRKRCHSKRNCSEVVVHAAADSTGPEMPEAATAVLDLNLPPPGSPLVRMMDQGVSLNEMLDLKLGYN